MLPGGNLDHNQKLSAKQKVPLGLFNHGVQPSVPSNPPKNIDLSIRMISLHIIGTAPPWLASWPALWPGRRSAWLALSGRLSLCPATWPAFWPALWSGQRSVRPALGTLAGILAGALLGRRSLVGSLSGRLSGRHPGRRSAWPVP